MDVKALVTHLAENGEEEILFLNLVERARRADLQGRVESGDFLSLSQRERAETLFEKTGIYRFFFWGGIEGAERRCPVFLPDYMSEDEAKENAFCSLILAEARFDRYNFGAQLSHRDVLGSLMALGVKRCAVGDIIIEKERVVFALREKTYPFVKENLEKISRYPVCVDIAQSAPEAVQDRREERVDTVPSLRLDAVTASLFRLSRADAAAFIADGKVSVNSVPASKVTSLVKEGDSISVRGYGRREITELCGETKKGRLKIVSKG